MTNKLCCRGAAYTENNSATVYTGIAFYASEKEALELKQWPMFIIPDDVTTSADIVVGWDTLRVSGAISAVEPPRLAMQVSPADKVKAVHPEAYIAFAFNTYLIIIADGTRHSGSAVLAVANSRDGAWRKACDALCQPAKYSAIIE